MAKLGIDCDGVLSDFHVDMGSYLVSIGRLTQEFVDGSMADQREWSLGKLWGIESEEFDEHFADGVDAGHVFLQSEPAPGSVRSLQRLQAKGHTIHIVTSRLQGLRFAHNTLDWLHENLYPYDSISFTHDKTLVDVDLLLDDHERNFTECRAAGMFVALLDQPWNRHVIRAPRVTWLPGSGLDTYEEYVNRVFPLH